MDTDAWFAALVAALPGAAGGREPVAPPTVTAGERDALLDLARVAAHAAERWTAPVSTFLAGVAYADLPSEARAEALRTLVAALDPDPTT